MASAGAGAYNGYLGTILPASSWGSPGQEVRDEVPWSWKNCSF